MHALIFVYRTTGFDHELGARPLARAMQQHLLAPLAQVLLAGKLDPKDTVELRTLEEVEHDKLQGFVSLAEGSPIAYRIEKGSFDPVDWEQKKKEAEKIARKESGEDDEDESEGEKNF